MGGWTPVRLAIGPTAESPVAGAQLLLRRIPVVGWHLAYAPRGPIGRMDDPRTRAAFMHALRVMGRTERIATVRIDPEAAPDTPYGSALMSLPWRAAPKVQPPTTRVVDLTLGEEALRANLKRKHRQYVNKAERAGVTIERFDGSSPADVIGPALADFNRIGDRIDAAGDSPLPDVILLGRSVLDFSVRFGVTRMVTARFDAKNLLDSPYETIQGTATRELYRTGRTIQAGFQIRR